jgi:hypothetical protein
MPPEPFISPANEYEDAPSEDEIAATAALDDTEAAASPEDMARRNRRIKLQVERVQRAWKDMMATPHGREAVWELLNDCGITQMRIAKSPFGFPDTNETFFEAGKHAVGEALSQKLQIIDYESHRAMMLEHHPAFAPPRKTKRAKPQ